MSLPRSRGAKAPAGRGAGKPARGAAARPAGGRQVMVATAKPDIFVALLGVALGAILLGCLMLVLKLNQYGFETKAVALPTAPSATALA